MENRSKKGYLLRRPAGPSELFPLGNNHHGTNEAIGCGLCGTIHPKTHPDEPIYHTFTFLGKSGVVECCGVVVDRLYRDWSEEFTEERLRYFGTDPLSDYFASLRDAIQKAAKDWGEAVTKKVEEKRDLDQLMAELPC